MISEEDVAEGLTRIRAMLEKEAIHATFFEITTALALDYFQRQKTDVVILETGLGGRFDATNVVTPKVSVLTAIDFDHMAWLGSTLGEIAFEKAGIIKPGVPGGFGAAAGRGGQLFFSTAAPRVRPFASSTTPVTQPAHASGESPEAECRACDCRACRRCDPGFGRGLSPRDCSPSSWPGRFQIFDDRVILDGAHNRAAADRLVLTWREVFGNEKAIVILGVLRDKDVGAMCSALGPVAFRFITTEVRSPRSCSAAMLAEAIAVALPSVPCRAARSLSSAMELASRDRQRILVTGSLFLVGEAISLLEGGSQAPEFTSQ